MQIMTKAKSIFAAKLNRKGQNHGKASSTCIITSFQALSSVFCAAGEDSSMQIRALCFFAHNCKGVKYRLRCGFAL